MVMVLYAARLAKQSDLAEQWVKFFMLWNLKIENFHIFLLVDFTLIKR